MKKSKNVLIALVFTLAIGGAFASRSGNAVTMNYLDVLHCPNTDLVCPFTVGILCNDIFLDPNCTIPACRAR